MYLIIVENVSLQIIGTFSQNSEWNKISCSEYPSTSFLTYDIITMHNLWNKSKVSRL